MQEPLFEPIELLEKLANWAGLGVAAVSSIAFRAAASKVGDVNNKLDQYELRIAHIESRFVTRDDLEGILRDLKHDLNQGFDRTHQRIDQLYSDTTRHKPGT